MQYLDIWLGQMQNVNQKFAKKLAGFDEDLPKGDAADFENSVLKDLSCLDTIDVTSLATEVPDVEDSDIWKK